MVKAHVSYEFTGAHAQEHTYWATYVKTFGFSNGNCHGEPSQNCCYLTICSRIDSTFFFKNTSCLCAIESVCPVHLQVIACACISVGKESFFMHMYKCVFEWETTDVHAAVDGTWGSSALAWAGRSLGVRSDSEIPGARGKTWPTPCSSCTRLAQPPTCGDKTQRIRYQGCVVNHNLTAMTNESCNVCPDRHYQKLEIFPHGLGSNLNNRYWLSMELDHMIMFCCNFTILN